ncbi:hypothetical protein GCM10007389_12060 [Pontibacter akesuensis]|nr:hypothetical protein GCM10007389_12060 [Pontibacter akesuensis]
MSALIGCRAKYVVGNERRYTQNLKDAFVNDFKTISFCECLKAGNDYKTSEDVSCRYPDYLYTEGDVIKNLIQVEQGKITRDSIDRIGRVAEGMEGKRVVEICMEFYQSKALDSVARSRFR